MQARTMFLFLSATTLVGGWYFSGPREEAHEKHTSHEPVIKMIEESASEGVNEKSLNYAMNGVIAASRGIRPEEARLLKRLRDRRGTSLETVRELILDLRRANGPAATERAAAMYLDQALDNPEREFKRLRIALDAIRGESGIERERLVLVSLADQISPSTNRATDLLFSEIELLIERSETTGPTDARSFSEFLQRMIRRAQGPETAIRDALDIYRMTDSTPFRRLVREELARAYPLESRSVTFN